MTVQEYMSNTEPLTRLMRVNELIMNVSGGYCIVDAIEKARDRSAYPSWYCDGGCAECLAKLLNTEVKEEEE